MVGSTAPLYAGLDWSGHPAPGGREYLYVPCIVAVPDPDALDSELARARAELRLSTRFEFRGQACTEVQVLRGLQVLECLDARVAATLYDLRSPQSAEPRPPLPGAQALPAESALALLAPLLRAYPLARLWYDEEIAGAKQRTAFATAVLRLNREIRPGSSGLKVGCKRSDSCGAIQLADVVAYALSRLARGKLELPDLRLLAEAARDDPRHLVRGPVRWGAWEGDDLRS